MDAGRCLRASFVRATGYKLAKSAINIYQCIIA